MMEALTRVRISAESMRGNRKILCEIQNFAFLNVVAALRLAGSNKKSAAKVNEFTNSS